MKSRLKITNGDAVPDAMGNPEAYFAYQLESPSKNRILGLKISGKRIKAVQRVAGEGGYSDLNMAISELNSNQYFLVSFEDIVEQYKIVRKLKKAYGIGVGLVFGSLMQLGHLYAIITHDLEGSIAMNLIPLFVMIISAYGIFKKGSLESYE